MTDECIETWKPIRGWQNYDVSDLGRVRNHKTGRILKFFNHAGGYDLVDLSEGGVGKTFTVHRLVANAFLLNEFNRAQVDHRDGNKKNNKLSNLSWVSSAENNNRKPSAVAARFRREIQRMNAINI